ncbi:MAG: hypothetical protein QOH27_4613 [Mycobacterium sp.]|nr:hypothetical protein [Mycobacterium sp.]
MESPVGESGRCRRQCVDGLVGEKDCVANGFRELLDAGCHVDGVTDEGETRVVIGDFKQRGSLTMQQGFPSNPAARVRHRGNYVWCAVISDQ